MRGMRTSQFVSVLEVLSDALVCQHIGLSAGIQVLNRLPRTRETGLKPIRHGKAIIFSFSSLASRDHVLLRQLECSSTTIAVND